MKEKCTHRVNLYSSTCLELLDIDPESFALLLDFLYTGDFSPRGGHLAADLFASLASNNKHTPPAEVREGIPKLETAEPAIDSSSLQVDSSDSQKDLNLGNSRKTKIKKDKKESDKKYAISEEVPCDSQTSPYHEELASCDAIIEETKHDYRYRNCGYG